MGIMVWPLFIEIDENLVMYEPYWIYYGNIPNKQVLIIIHCYSSSVINTQICLTSKNNNISTKTK